MLLFFGAMHVGVASVFSFSQLRSENMFNNELIHITTIPSQLVNAV
jgi:hypothetical protein